MLQKYVGILNQKKPQWTGRAGSAGFVDRP